MTVQYKSLYMVVTESYVPIFEPACAKTANLMFFVILVITCICIHLTYYTCLPNFLQSGDRGKETTEDQYSRDQTSDLSFCFQSNNEIS